MDRSPLLALHEAAGARLRTEDGPPVVLSFGDVPAEYRAAQEACAVFDEADRGRVEVRGDEAIAFLHRLLASDVRALSIGRGQRSVLLSSKGKVLFDLDVLRAEDHLSASLPPGRAAAFLKSLDTYLFAEKVKLADTSSEHAPLGVAGPRSDEVVRSATGLEPPTTDYAWIRGSLGSHDLNVQRVPIAGSPGFRVDAGPAGCAELWTRLRDRGAIPAGIVARDILRVEAGHALAGEDVDENVYPQEARLESAFSLTKGCYVGQEVVAKIDTYGGLNKRLVALKISHDDPVPRGTRLYSNDDGERRDLGVLTSWAYSFVLDTGLALGYVKRRHQRAGTVFQVGDSDAEAQIVPIPVRAGAIPVTGEFE